MSDKNQDKLKDENNGMNPINIHSIPTVIRKSIEQEKQEDKESKTIIITENDNKSMNMNHMELREYMTIVNTARNKVCKLIANQNLLLDNLQFTIDDVLSDILNKKGK